jgi:hypothetical protein
LDNKRQGKALLKSTYTPEAREFQLEVFSIDKLGHMRLGVELKKGHYFDAVQAKLGFEIDPSKVPYLVEQFTKLINDLKHERAS